MPNQVPTRPAAREKIYDILDGEREYQQKTHPTHPPAFRSVADFASLLDTYVHRLRRAVSSAPGGAGGDPLKRLREIAAIAVHAMEIHGAQPRENHVPPSAGITGVVKIVGSADSTKPAPSRRG